MSQPILLAVVAGAFAGRWEGHPIRRWIDSLPDCQPLYMAHTDHTEQIIRDTIQPNQALVWFGHSNGGDEAFTTSCDMARPRASFPVDGLIMVEPVMECCAEWFRSDFDFKGNCIVPPNVQLADCFVADHDILPHYSIANPSDNWVNHPLAGQLQPDPNVPVDEVRTWERKSLREHLYRCHILRNFMIHDEPVVKLAHSDILLDVRMHRIVEDRLQLIAAIQADAIERR